MPESSQRIHKLYFFSKNRHLLAKLFFSNVIAPNSEVDGVLVIFCTGSEDNIGEGQKSIGGTDPEEGRPGLVR